MDHGDGDGDAYDHGSRRWATMMDHGVVDCDGHGDGFGDGA